MNNNNSRQLPDVFKELQQARLDQEISSKLNVKKASLRNNKVNDRQAKKREKREYAYRTMWNNHIASDILNFNVKKATIVTLCICALVLTLVSRNYILATENSEETSVDLSSINFEKNDNAINLTQIVSQNATVVDAKEYVKEEREVAFETVYIEDTSLQKDEQVVTQEGVNGKEEVYVVKTYKNGEFIEENILESEILEEPVKAIVRIGTSEFLSTYQVHLGDTLYVTGDTILRASASETSAEVYTIPQYLDVKLLELSGDWCKVSFDDYEGYVKNTTLTSASYTPSIVEKSRLARIFMNFGEDMDLNQSSGLTLEDFKKVLSNNSSDTNKIFEQSAEAFYNVDQNYGVNGIFIAAIGINESAWGTSNIALTKKNLFGYGAYDRDPYEYAYTFETYEDGIDLVAKVMVKHYLNKSGTEIYDGEIATGKYYNGTTLEAVNQKYASDTEWADKVFSYMEYLYNKLK